MIQRGNDRAVCFITERDHIVYLNKLRESSEANGIAIHSYVLTPYSDGLKASKIS